MLGTMTQFHAEQAAWSQATFGKDTERGPIGPMLHLAKEVEEVLADIRTPNAADKLPEEFADCLFLLFDASRRAGISYDALLNAAWVKLEKNKRRTWPKPKSNDEPVEHDRSKDA
jgi:NTP pyrophosphatase (non-canonical NTP hydrolase)